MKKITLLVAALAFVMFNVQAQEDLVSKKGFKILPEAGDYAFGVDFAPFIKTVNLNASNTAPSFDLADGLAIFGKYYTTDDMAYRVKFAFNRNSETRKNYVRDESLLVITPENQIADKGTFSYAQFALSVGFEKRRGQGRLQGYYGADLFFMYNDGNAANQNFSSEYGNEFSSTITNPDHTAYVAPKNGFRTANVDQGAQFGVGARAFVGAEYFIAPKISIGGELGWGVAYAAGFDGEQTDEEWDNVDLKVKSTTVKTGNNSGFVVGSDGASNTFNGWTGLGGNINLIFHF